MTINLINYYGGEISAMESLLAQHDARVTKQRSQSVNVKGEPTGKSYIWYLLQIKSLDELVEMGLSSVMLKHLDKPNEISAYWSFDGRYTQR